DRSDHPTLKPEEAEGALSLYYRSFQTPSRREADELIIVGPPPVFVHVTDLTAHIATRRHIILGAIHGCFDELRELLGQLQYEPAGDVVVSVGDIVDRGPKIRGVVEYLFGLPDFHMVLGNHEDKLLRHLQAHGVRVSGGLQTTTDAYGGRFPPDLAE